MRFGASLSPSEIANTGHLSSRTQSLCPRSSFLRGACALLVLLVSVTVLPPARYALASGPTNVSGTISSNTTWSASNSPYVVTGDILVAYGVTLTIDPGVVIRFQRPVSGYYDFEVRGQLVAAGTSSQHITITSDRDSTYGGTGGAAAGDFRGVRFYTVSPQTTPTTRSIFDYVDFRYGGYGGGGVCNAAMLMID